MDKEVILRFFQQGARADGIPDLARVTSLDEIGEGSVLFIDRNFGSDTLGYFEIVNVASPPKRIEGDFGEGSEIQTGKRIPGAYDYIQRQVVCLEPRPIPQKFIPNRIVWKQEVDLWRNVYKYQPKK